MLAEQEMTKQEFREELQIASGTMTKLNKGQEVSMSIILRIRHARTGFPESAISGTQEPDCEAGEEVIP